MIYRQHREDHDLSEGELDPANPVLDGTGVRLCRTTDESKASQQRHGPAVIISTSGMMTGGRILHHLKQRLPSARNTVVLGGFQADGTRGRMLQDGAKWLRMSRPRRARAGGHRIDPRPQRPRRPQRPVALAATAQTAQGRVLVHGEVPARKPSAKRFSASVAGTSKFPRWEACISSTSG